MLSRHEDGKLWERVYDVAGKKAPEIIKDLQTLALQSTRLENKIAAQRRELRRLNKSDRWAAMAVKVYERISREIDESLKRHGIELPLRVNADA